VHVVYIDCDWLTVCMWFTLIVIDWQCACGVHWLWLIDSVHVVYIDCDWLTVYKWLTLIVIDWQCACG